MCDRREQGDQGEGVPPAEGRELKAEHCFSELRRMPIPENYGRVYGLLLEELEDLLAAGGAREATPCPQCAALTEERDKLLHDRAHGLNGAFMGVVEANDLRAQLADAQQEIARLEDRHWTCFHCGETFTTVGAASDHFGAAEGTTPGCLIDRVALEEGGKPERGRGLLMALRTAEATLAALTEEAARLRKAEEWFKANNEGVLVSVAIRHLERAQTAEAQLAEAERHNLQVRRRAELAEGRANAAEEGRDIYRQQLAEAERQRDAARELFSSSQRTIAELEQERASLIALVEQLKKDITEICTRIEASLPADAETHREVSIARQRRIEAVYALAESALTSIDGLAALLAGHAGKEK